MIRTNYINMPYFHPSKELVLNVGISCNNLLTFSIKTIQTQLILKVIGLKINRLKFKF